MERADKGLAFMLRYENVACYDNGTVTILDRRIYPVRVGFVACKRHNEVALAITEMVTQGEGAYTAAGMGMALAAYEARSFDKIKFKEYMTTAAYTLSHARPTTVKLMELITSSCLEVALMAREEGRPPDIAVHQHMLANLDARYQKSAVISQYLVDMLPKKGTVITQCFGETILGQTLRIAKERGYDLKLICPETRPYLQGARLTASVAKDMGYDVTVITDNMAATTIHSKKVDVFTSTASVICLDGHVVNKVGTLQIAIIAKHFGIPCFVTGTPDKAHETIGSVTIEECDPELCLEAMSVRTVMAGVKGYYPAFDVTPPQLVGGVVTDRGVFSPYDLRSYFKDNNQGLYDSNTNLV